MTEGGVVAVIITVLILGSVFGIVWTVKRRRDAFTALPVEVQRASTRAKDAQGSYRQATKAYDKRVKQATAQLKKLEDP